MEEDEDNEEDGGGDDVLNDCAGFLLAALDG